jgi:hypothetical protein
LGNRAHTNREIGGEAGERVLEGKEEKIEGRLLLDLRGICEGLELIIDVL